MIPSNIKAIFFDAVGTLIHPEPGAAAVYWDVGRRHGSKLDLHQIVHRFRSAFQAEEDADRAAGWRTCEEREYRRWQHIVASVLDDVSNPSACFGELYLHFARPDAWRLEADAPRVLAELEQRGYVLGMASNYDQRLRSVVAGLPLQALKHLVISSEVGWRKPAGEFFAALAAAVAMTPSQILYIGDDWANDYQGAVAAGLQALLFNPRGEPGSLQRFSHLLPDF